MHNWERKQSAFKGISKEPQASATGYQHTNFCSLCGAWYGQLGLEPTPDLYVEHLSLVFKELYRVLKKTGLFFLNIGDTYSGKQDKYQGWPDNKQRPEILPTFDREGDFAAKCLLCMPERIMFSCINMGFILRNKIPWIKENPMPSSVTDRFSCSWEYIYMFSKTSDTQYWTNKKTGQLVSKQPKGIHGEEGKDWEWRECPKCEGTGKIIEGTCPRCEGTGEIKHSFWKGHDYFFDIDALRMPHSEEALARYGRGFGSPTNKYNDQDPAMIGGAKIDLRPKEFKNNERLKYKGKEDEITFTSAAKLGKFRDEERKRKKTADESFKAGGMRQSPEPGEEGAFNVRGRGPRDYFILPTMPFSKAHFAVFPASLIFQPILVGCPKEVCKKCGKPRVRIIKVNRSKCEIKKWDELENNLGGKAKGNMDKDLHKRKNLSGIFKYAVGSERQTIGWSDCGCNASFVPGVVIDPFIGAGTTALVSYLLDRDYIGIDILKEYCKMSKGRIKDPKEMLKATNSIKKAFPKIWEREVIKQLKLF